MYTFQRLQPQLSYSKESSQPAPLASMKGSVLRIINHPFPMTVPSYLMFSSQVIKTQIELIFPFLSRYRML